MNTKPFNLNHHVRVKITELGMNHLRARHDALMMGITGHPFSPPEVDDEGYSRMQLHEVMYNFGDLCFNGFNIPIETEILIEFEGE